MRCYKYERGGWRGRSPPHICKTSNRMAKALLLANSLHAYYLNGRLLFLSVFLPFFLSFFRSFFVSFYLSFRLSFFLSVFQAKLSLCRSFFVSFFVSFFSSFPSFVLSLFLSLFISFFCSLFVSFFLSFVRGAKNQEPLKARTCRKSPRGEPSQGRAEPLEKKKHGPSLQCFTNRDNDRNYITDHNDNNSNTHVGCAHEFEITSLSSLLVIPKSQSREN